MMIIYIK